MSDQKLSYEQIMRIIDLCKVVEKQGFDPFNVDVKSSLRTLKKYLPHWKELDELLLDMEAIRRITGLIRLQGEWIKHRVSTLYVDPLLVELKLKILSEETLASIFLKSLHPIVSLDQISPAKVKQALDYWNSLLPLKERMIALSRDTSLELGSISFDELIRLKLLSEEEFNDNLQKLWSELLEKRSKYREGKIPYWEFIASESYEDSVRRAYLTSFLVSEGYAAMEIDPLGETIYIVANDEQKLPPKNAFPRSIAVTFDNECWQKILESRGNV
ncbi:MAG: hypothetical protein ACE5J2_01965 [Nitrososphaerales archaeon]